MFLQNCEITNFRGLRHLKVSFEQDSTILIGENAWGKSSLLSALYLMLGQNQICTFEKEDLYVPIELQFVDKKAQAERAERALTRSQRGWRQEGTVRPALIFDTDRCSGSAADKASSEGVTAQQLQAEALSENEEELGEMLSEPLRQLFMDDYDFVQKDVFVSEAKFLAIDLIFCEPGFGVLEKSKRLQMLNPAWQLCSDGLYRIHWQALGYARGDNFITEHYLLDRHGQIIECATEQLLQKLISMNPVLRMRDSRTQMVTEQNELPADNPQEQEILDFSRQLTELQTSDPNSAEIMAGLETLNQLSDKYLSFYGHNQHIFRRGRSDGGIRDLVTRPVSLESLASLKTLLRSSDLNKEKILAVLFASSLFMSKGLRQLDRHARPIVILEDIEARFHPSLLLSFWSVVENVPVQKIVTTNSGELISAISLFALRRLCRQYYDTRCYAVPRRCLNADDLRRIAFHIRLNRPMSLFARSWVLVEGETEIWLISGIAAILGVSLTCEGIRMVEFAQCGLHPLMKLASALGISFYVLTDGDEAGQRYAQSVGAFVGKQRVHDHLTVLPHLDIEHFLYANGYAEVFQQAAGLNAHQLRGLHADKIIEQAIHKKSKPGLALTVLSEMEQRGPDGVPALLQEMISKLLKLAKNEMGLD